MQMLDKAKKKVEKMGVKRSSVRLEDEGSVEGLPFPAPPPQQGALSIAKLAGLLIATIVLAGVFSVVVLGVGRGKPASRPQSPAASPSAAASPPASLSSAALGDTKTPDTRPAASLVNELNTSNIKGHLERLYAIALSHGGNRAMGNSGYNASVQYVLQCLSSMRGFRVSVQDFVVSKNKVCMPREYD